MKIPLHIQKYLDIKNSKNIEMSKLSLQEAREKFKRNMIDINIPIDNLHQITDHSFINENDKIKIRIYYPCEDYQELPIMLYCHGGGFILGDLDAYDADCRRLCDAIKCVVISVDYRLAPEHRYPAAINDCYKALEWIKKNPNIVGGNLEKIFIAGDSAGAMIAAEVIFKALEAHNKMRVFT